MRSCFCRTTLPLLGASEPIKTRSSVDLPDPFGPTIVTISPASRPIETSSSTVVPANRTETL